MTNVSALPTHAKWRTLEVALLRVYDGAVRLGANSDSPTRNANFRAWLLRKGKAEIGVQSRPHVLRIGHWYFPPQEVSWQRFSSNAQLLSLTFRASWPDGRLIFDLGEGIDLLARNFPDLETAALGIKKVVDERLSGLAWFLDGEALDLASYVELNQALNYWLLTLNRSFEKLGIHPARTSFQDERVELALQWLNTTPLNVKFRESQLAHYLGLSIAHLNRLFAREIGMSPVDVIERRRWERANDSLEYSRIPIKQLSYDLGFSSPSHFTAWFKAKTGKTPRDFRKG